MNVELKLSKSGKNGGIEVLQRHAFNVELNVEKFAVMKSRK